MKQFGMSLLSWQLIILIWLMTKALLIPIFFILKKKFIPASDYMSAIKVAKRLQDDGFTPIINLLGEHCVSRKKIKQTFRQYLYLVDALCEAGIKGKISVKPTQLGLAISKEIYCEYIVWLSRRAHNQKISLEIDMENIKYLDSTLEAFLKIPGEYNVRQAIQAYLKRSEKDAREFISWRRKVRLARGAYAEGDLNKSETRAQIKNLAEQFLVYGNEPAIATIGNEELINDVFEFASRRDISKDHFIIQTLYGARDDLKHKWRDKGFRVEVYVPVGSWHKALPYVWRRIKEILKNTKTS